MASSLLGTRLKAGNAFEAKDKDSGTANGFHACLAFDMRSVGHFPERSRAARH